MEQNVGRLDRITDRLKTDIEIEGSDMRKVLSPLGHSMKALPSFEVV